MKNLTKAGAVVALAAAVGIGIYQFSNGSGYQPIHIDDFKVEDVYNSTNHVYGKRFTFTESGCVVGSTNYIVASETVNLPMVDWSPIIVFIPTNDPYTFIRIIYTASVQNKRFFRIMGNPYEALGMFEEDENTFASPEGFELVPVVRSAVTNRPRLICTNHPPPPLTNIVKRTKGTL